MMSLSHWGMFLVDHRSGMEKLIQFLQDRDDRVLYGVPGFENMGLMRL